MMVPTRTPLDTRRRILLAAMELFALKGYASTSVSDILSRSQANSGSLYHFFPGKQDVLIGVLEMYRDGIEEMLLAPAWGGVADPIERIFALLASYRAMLIESDCLYGCPIGRPRPRDPRPASRGARPPRGDFRHLARRDPVLPRGGRRPAAKPCRPPGAGRVR